MFPFHFFHFRVRTFGPVFFFDILFESTFSHDILFDFALVVNRQKTVVQQQYNSSQCSQWHVAVTCKLIPDLLGSNNQRWNKTTRWAGCALWVRSLEKVEVGVSFDRAFSLELGTRPRGLHLGLPISPKPLALS